MGFVFDGIASLSPAFCALFDWPISYASSDFVSRSACFEGGCVRRTFEENL